MTRPRRDFLRQCGACGLAVAAADAVGGDVLGLTRAWIYAGTPSVLASLWKVDDRATSRLMTAFYENLKTHDKAKALQLAQLDMIKEGLSPYYWAAFCLYGDYQ